MVQFLLRKTLNVIFQLFHTLHWLSFTKTAVFHDDIV